MNFHNLNLLFIMLLLKMAATASGLQNITIDDEFGDITNGLKPTYAPEGQWTQGSTCTGCWAKLDPSFTYDGTWHDSTIHPGNISHTVTILFNGETRDHVIH